MQRRQQLELSLKSKSSDSKMSFDLSLLRHYIRVAKLLRSTFLYSIHIYSTY